MFSMAVCGPIDPRTPTIRAQNCAIFCSKLSDSLPSHSKKGSSHFKYLKTYFQSLLSQISPPWLSELRQALFVDRTFTQTTLYFKPVLSLLLQFLPLPWQVSHLHHSTPNLFICLWFFSSITYSSEQGYFLLCSHLHGQLPEQGRLLVKAVSYCWVTISYPFSKLFSWHLFYSSLRWL